MNPQHLLTASHIAVLLGVLLAGFGGFGTYHFGKKADEDKANDVAAKENRLSEQIDSLAAQLSSFEDIALRLYPDLSKDEAIEKLKNNYEQLQKEFETQKNTLRSLSSQLKFTFSGKWNSKPYPKQLMSPASHQYYVELSNANQSVKFYASEVYKFKTLDDNRAEFQSKQEVKAGSFPLGKLLNTLDSFTQINLYIPFFLGDSIEDKRITVEKIELVFAVNGVGCNPLIVEKHHATNLLKKGNTCWASIVMAIDPSTTEELFQKKARELIPEVKL